MDISELAQDIVKTYISTEASRRGLPINIHSGSEKFRHALQGELTRAFIETGDATPVFVDSTQREVYSVDAGYFEKRTSRVDQAA